MFAGVFSAQVSLISVLWQAGLCPLTPGAVWLTLSGGDVVLQGMNWPVPPHPRPLSPVGGEGRILCGLAQ